MVQVRQILVLAWLVALPGLTAMRASVWQNDVTLWTEATWRSEKPRVWINLGGALLAAQQYEQATLVLDHADVLIGDRRDPIEQRVSYVYARLVQAHLAQLEGRWDVAQQLAQQLNVWTERRWPPAVAFCRTLDCASR